MNTKYRLYGRPNTSSAAVEATLEEAGLPYDLVDLGEGADGRLATLPKGLNPLGQVPVLVLPDGTVMTESCAIIMHLSDLHAPDKLSPLLQSAKRPAFLRWMVFLAANTYMADLRFYGPARYTDDPQGAEAVRSAARKSMARDFEIVAGVLGDSPWLLGETFSALDIYAAMLVSWAENVPNLFARHPELGTHYKRVSARPKIAPVWARHRMHPDPSGAFKPS